jgi:hypothetical protein
MHIQFDWCGQGRTGALDPVLRSLQSRYIDRGIEDLEKTNIREIFTLICRVSAALIPRFAPIASGRRCGNETFFGGANQLGG